MRAELHIERNLMSITHFNDNLADHDENFYNKLVDLKHSLKSTSLS